MNWLLQLLGARIEGDTSLTNVALTFRQATDPVFLAIIGIALIALAVWAYRFLSEELTGWRTSLLAGLRIAFFLLVLALLLRPTLALTLEGRVRRTLVMLFDGSGSMGIRDGEATRLENVKTALAKEHINLRRLQHHYDLAPFQFGKELQELVSSNQTDWVTLLNTNSPVSAVGDAVREVISRKRGQPLAGILLLTDGANNAGSSPRETAVLAGEEGVPLYIHGVGREIPKDIIISSVFAQELAFAEDEVAVTVRVRGQGVAGRTARLTLSLGEQLVDQQNISFSTDSEQVVTMVFKPKEKGEFDLKAAIEPFADEIVKDNNERSQHLRVIDAKIKVLLVEQSPRWEWRYLQAMLMRDRRVELKCVLMEGDPGIAAGETSPYLEEFPKIKEDLLKYDLVVFGDVDPRALTPEQTEMLGKFVSDFGGAFLMIAGKRFSPSAYRRTVIERMLPVEFDYTQAEGFGDTLANVPIKLELTPAGRVNSMMQLSDKTEDNIARWAGLPPIYWTSRVTRSKPAAEVLLVDADPTRATRSGKMPIIATQQYGMGHVMFVGTDNTWRWRKNVGDTYYVTFWGQVVQRLALTHLLGGAKRTQLSANRQNYHTGDRVTVYARLYTASFEPLTENGVRGYYLNRTAPGAGPGAATEVLLRPVAEQAGMYRGEFVAPVAGNYKFHLEREQDTQLDFNVLTPQFEMGDTAMNEPLLREMAKLSGGMFLADQDLPKLPEILGRQRDTVTTSQEVELWSSPFYFLLLLLVITAEWALRKLFHLK